MSYRRGATPEEDRAVGDYQQGWITRVDDSTSHWTISWSESAEDKTIGTWGFGLSKDRCPEGFEPQVGDALVTYGSFGRPVHGVEVNGQLLWYWTPEEEDEDHRQMVARMQAEKRAKFEENREQLDVDYAALPGVFQQRIDKFRNTNPDFRWEFESYEMFCCTEAVKIADYCSRMGIQLEDFRNLTYEAQCEQAGISGDHSGNTFGMAMRLADWYLVKPELVVADHGALTPLVGCEEYGCPHDN